MFESSGNPLSHTVDCAMCPTVEPAWVLAPVAAKTDSAVSDLLVNLMDAGPLVWGGDWNHALTGREYAGSQGGRQAVLRALDHFGLAAPTAELPHAIDGLLSIDHIAVPRDGRASAYRIVAAREGKRLSNHDAYVIDVDLP